MRPSSGQKGLREARQREPAAADFDGRFIGEVRNVHSDGSSSRTRVRGIEPRRALSATHGALDRDVGELPAVAGRPQQHAAPAHVASADEVGRKEEPRAEDLEERRAILVRGDAPEEDDAGLVGRGAGEALEVAHEGPAIGRFRRRDRDRREPQHVLPPHGGLGWQEAGRRRDHEDGPGRKTLRVRELAAEVQAGEKREHFPEGRAPGRTQPDGEVEPRSIPEKNLGPPARGAGGRD